MCPASRRKLGPDADPAGPCTLAEPPGFLRRTVPMVIGRAARRTTFRRRSDEALWRTHCRRCSERVTILSQMRTCTIQLSVVRVSRCFISEAKEPALRDMSQTATLASTQTRVDLLGQYWRPRKRLDIRPFRCMQRFNPTITPQHMPLDGERFLTRHIIEPL